ncbi:hypothetical protein [Glaciecola sp. SC05]|uniref:hypothetical protein n=1 Tax=Glaciecola sp. SC05 TaxID=1987355 RepID=UPI0035276EE2
MALRKNMVMRNAFVHSACLLVRARNKSMALLCSLLCATLMLSAAKATVVDAGFVVVYDNFSPQQVNQIMVYATRFKGYEQYEVLYQRSLDTQIHYQSEIDPKLLSFNFEQTFADLKWDVIAQQQGNQYQFTFVRVQPKPLPFGVW